MIIFLLAGLSLGYIFTPKKDASYEKSIESQLQHSRDQVEQLHKKIKNAERRDSVWISIEMMYQDSLQHSRKETSRWMKIYANIKNTPTPKFSESELDSLIGAIIR